MKTNFREILGIDKLRVILGIPEGQNLNRTLTVKQRKAVNNIKYCADDYWCYVNSWYDDRDEDCRRAILNPEWLFDEIYDSALKGVYAEGYAAFGEQAQRFIKDIRFTGKPFLTKVTFYYMVKLIEEAAPEVEATEADIQRITNTLIQMKANLIKS